MKSAFLVLGLIAPMMSFAAGNGVCEKAAERAVERFAEKGYYDVGGYNAYNCEIAPNNKAILCEVTALKGDGAAADTYRVVLNTGCTKAYRVELTGEE